MRTETKTITRTYYRYDELSDTAKEHARQKYNTFLWRDGEAQESMRLTAETMLDGIGLTLEDLTYNDLYSQGTNIQVSATGTMTLDGAECNVSIQPYLSASHQYVITGGDGGDDASNEAYDECEKIIDKTLSEMFWAMRDADEAMSNDEATREVSDANDWEYDEHGHLA